MEDGSRRIDSFDGRRMSLGRSEFFAWSVMAWVRLANPIAMIRFAAWLAAIIFAANPNLIYLQATAMTESLYLALFIWAMVYFNEFVREV